VNDPAVSQHYAHGDLLAAIRDGVTRLGKTTETVTVDELGPVDEFHIGGRIATEHLLDQLAPSEDSHLLDVGCGLGGASRYVADRYNNRVTGIDLVQEYVDVGNALSAWVNLQSHITLQQGSALSLPFADAAFDGAYMLHVGMNIEDKPRLFREVYRVLKPGARFGVYDIMRKAAGDLTFPVPWAGGEHTSRLATPNQYREALRSAGFTVSDPNDRGEFALGFFQKMRKAAEANGGPPPLGLHTLMQSTTPVKLKNMVDGIAAGIIAPVEMVARKP